MNRLMVEGNKKKLSWFLTVLILIVSVFGSGCSQKGEEKELYSGTVEAQESLINTEVGGKVSELLVEEGSSVKKNQTIGKIDSTTQSLQVSQAEAALKSAREKAAEVKKGNREEQIAQAAAAVKQITSMESSARAVMNNAKDNLDKVKKLYSEGGATEQQLSDAETKYTTAKYQVDSYAAQKASAQEQLQLLQKGATQESVNIADAGVIQAEALLETAKSQQNKTILKSPVAGVVSSVNFNQGEFISPGAALVSVIDMKDMWINIYVPEKELPLVKTGQKAKIYIDAYPDQPVNGKVVFISAKSEFTPKNLQTKEDRVNMVFAVKIKITDGLDRMRPGLPADVELVTE